MHLTRFIESRKAKFIAVFISFNMILEAFAPLISYGLTGGPSQPEVDSFEPVGTTQMVDLFSGDFNYNIPLFDLGGYPINIAYHGGIGMEQEASWVGLGWNINPGAITRTMRGIPDDFNGDLIKKIYSTKPNITYGVDMTKTFEFFGFNTAGFLGQAIEKSKSTIKNKTEALLLDSSVFVNKYEQSTKKTNNWSLNIGLGIYRNNYRGTGISLNIGADMQRTKNAAIGNYSYFKSQNSEKEQNEQESSSFLGGNVLYRGSFNMGFDSQNGVDYTGGLTFPSSKLVGEMGLNFRHNSIGGLKSVAFNYTQSVRTKKKSDSDSKKAKRLLQLGGPIPISNVAYTPNANANTTSQSYNIMVALGPEKYGFFNASKTNLYFNSQSCSLDKEFKSYGYLHESRTQKKENVLMDFNREKEGEFRQEMSHLPLAYATYDLYNIAGQGTGGVYRPHRNNIGIYKDPEHNLKTPWYSGVGLSLDLGLSQAAKFGFNASKNNNFAQYCVWPTDDGNEVVKKFNYKKAKNNKLFEEVYFKGGGELTPHDEDFYTSFGTDKPVKFILETNKQYSYKSGNFAILKDSIQSSGNNKSKPLALKENGRQIRSNVMRYLTANEASSLGVSLDDKIKSYPLNSRWLIDGSLNGYKEFIMPEVIERNSGIRRSHHISEITHYSPEGMQYVYGIPAYNIKQIENAFSVGIPSEEEVKTGLISFTDVCDSDSNNQGIQNLFTSTEIPPYAHSYLLTGVLSPDYVDLTGDGITDDDLGTAVRFNYTKFTAKYKWRAPYEKARLDEGLKSDDMDQTGSYVYGEKELWYVHSIVSKTHIAEFKLSPRYDGIGSVGKRGGIDDDAINNKNCQLKLDSIVIYSKLDRVKNGENATPVKTVVFVYDYSLCKGIPNSVYAGDSENIEMSGKLTLKEIYFTYGKSGKGRLSPYKFSYSDINPNYDLTKVDRWGNYALPDGRSLMVDYPFVKQRAEDANEIDANASAWCLTEIQLPSGGLIKVDYESDDYAYVQDKKAMQMFKIVGSGKNKDWDPKLVNNTLYEGSKINRYLFFKLNKPITEGNTKEVFKQEYLIDEKGKMIKELYFNFRVNMSKTTSSKKEGGNYEYISGYVPIDENDYGVCSNNSEYGYIRVPSVSQGDTRLKRRANAIAKMVWQDALLDKRHLVFAGSRTVGENDATAFRGLLGSFPQMLNVIIGPYQYLKYLNVGKFFKVEDSWVRLYNPHECKKGGGARVKQILINDNWAQMESDQKSTQYGQKFEYKQADKYLINKNTAASSGVASYEPLVGNEENPFKQPVKYEVGVKWGPNKQLFQEEPFGETAMPPASVGYSNVIVTNIAKNKSIGTSTGYTFNEFYTARDYPAVLSNTDVTYKDNDRGRAGEVLRSLFSYFKADYAAVSQGYVIKLNDMHGKAKAVKVYGEMNGGTDLISGTEYLYKEKEKGVLDNKVNVLCETSGIKEKIIGLEMDIALDTRRSFVQNINGSLTLDLDAFIPLIPIFIPYPNIGYTQFNTGFYSSVITKVVQQYGILEETIAYDYGSKVITKNHLWDEQTGSVLLTSVTNEFDDDIYNFSYPAHFAYDRMGPAYKNIGYEDNSITTNSSGKAFNLSYNPFVEGDELLLVNKNNSSEKIKGWVLKSQGSMIQIIDRNGDGIKGDFRVKIIRSGRRNLSAIPVGSIATMYNPMPEGVDTTLTLDNNIIQSAATTFSDEWPGYCDLIHYKIVNVCADTINFQELFYPIYKKQIEAFGFTSVEAGYHPDFNYHPNLLNAPLVNIFDVLSNQTYSGKRGVNISNWGENDTIKNALINSIKDQIDINIIDWDSVFVYYREVPLGNTAEYDLALKLKDSDNYFVFGFPMCFFPCPDGFSVPEQLIPGTFFHDSLLMGNMNFDSLSSSYTNNIVNGFITSYIYNGTDSLEFWFCKHTTVPFTYSSNLGQNLIQLNDCKYVPCSLVMQCDYKLGETVNPFVNGMRGTWRPQASHAIVADRNYNYQYDTTDIRHDGLIKDYTPFWKFNSTGQLVHHPNANQKWVESNRITIFSPEGNELEEQNALGIFSAQLYGYTNTLVTAVAANAKHKQIAFDHFEDYSYPYIGCRNEGHWDFKKNMPSLTYSVNIGGSFNNASLSKIDVFLPDIDEQLSDVYIADSIAHTGLHSLAIRPGKSHYTTSKIDYNSLELVEPSDTSLFRLDNYSKCISSFAPDTGYNYVVSAWVHEELSNLNSVNTFINSSLKVEILNGLNVLQSITLVPEGKIIEGWQRIYGTFKLSDNTNIDKIKVTLENKGEVTSYFDDIRIHPVNSSMVSYVYHPVHLKIMAELDDNNFATFYEYDDEGSLIRIKKETEKGVLTIQESRKSVKKVQ